MFSLTAEERKDISRKVGEQQLKEGKGIHQQTIEDRKKLGEYCRDNKIGFHALSNEERSDIAKTNYANGKGLASYSKEQRQEWTKRAIEASIIARKQRWKCTITGYISNPCGLSKYQNNRGINKKNRTQIL